MAGKGFQVEMPDRREFLADVRQFARPPGGLGPALKVIRENIYDVLDNAFRGRGRVMRSSDWADLSNRPWVDPKTGRMIRPGYLDWKTGMHGAEHPGSEWWAYQGPRGGYFPEPLSRSGRLMQSLTSRGKGNRWRARRDGFVFGTGVKYAGYHEKGEGNLPKRAMLDWDVVGAGSTVWTPAILKPVQRLLRVGAKNLEKYGQVDADELFAQIQSPAIERRR